MLGLKRIMIFVRKFDYVNLSRGEKKIAESKNGRRLLRFAVKAEHGVNLEYREIKKGEYGKPFLEKYPDIQFSISHSGSLVAVMLSRFECGVDIQKIKEVKQGVVRKICNDDELRFIENSTDKDRAFITLWALKESYVKAIGKGLSFSLAKVNFRIDTECGEITDIHCSQKGSFYVKNFEEYILAACTLDEVV